MDRTQVRTINISALCGGSGTRLWPVSRESMPKQFGTFGGAESLLSSTIKRLTGIGDRFHINRALALGNYEHRFKIADVAVPLGFEVLVEPQSRDTTAAIGALCALLARDGEGDTPLLVCPSDHKVEDQTGFSAAIERSVELVDECGIVLLGVEPTAPETGYGYIEAELGNGGALGNRVTRFHEKPAAEVAKGYLQNPAMFWNSGLFVLLPSVVLDQLSKTQPELLSGVEAAIEQSRKDLDYLVLGEDAYSNLKAKSFDYEVLEKADHLGFVPASFEWTDLGSWQSVHQVAPKDELNTAAVGRSVSLGAENSYLDSSGPLLVAQGVENIIAVATSDAVLITEQDKSQKVKDIVSSLKEQYVEISQHKRVYRPWGWYESVVEGERFQVKKIGVNPGSKLSLQKHFHRAEHWVVVEGTALVQIDDNQMQLTENESTYIPLGAVHRLSNPGHIPLTLIEVQTGSYLGEDDIVRFEDVYGRAENDEE